MKLVPKIFIVLIILIATFWIFKSIDVASVANMDRKVPIYSVGTEEKKVAISFDAAWGNDKTGGILDILEQYDVKATFFLVNFWAEDYPEDVKEISKRGHEIGNHSASHPDMTDVETGAIKKELKCTSDTIEALTGKPTKLFRPPFGAYDNHVIEACESEGYQVIQWSIDSLDWKDLSTEQIVDRITRNVKAGDIILCHNDAEHVLEYLPLVLENLQSQGFKVVCVGDLVYKDGYTVDNAGKQILKEKTTSDKGIDAEKNN